MIQTLQDKVISFFTNCKKSNLTLGFIALAALKALYIPKASLLTNIVHVIHKVVQLWEKPMHLVKSTDLPGINRHRWIYSLLTIMEPVYKTRQEQISFESKTGHTIYIELQKPVQSENKKLPVVVFFHGGGFVIGNVCMS